MCYVTSSNDAVLFQRRASEKEKEKEKDKESMERLTRQELLEGQIEEELEAKVR